MATIREIAEQCGVSKSTAARAAQRLGISGSKTADKRGTINLSADDASALAHELTKNRTQRNPSGNRVADKRKEPIQTDSESVQNQFRRELPEERIERIYRERVSDLKEQISLLTNNIRDQEERIKRLEEELESKNEQLRMHESRSEAARDEIANLKSTIVKMKNASLSERIFGYKKLLGTGKR